MVPEDINTLVKNANNGDSEAIKKLAKLYRDDKQLSSNKSEKEQWLCKAATIGIDWAINDYFDILWEKRTGPTDKIMIDLITPLADAGNGGAMGRLARAYKDGRGVEKNFEKALKLEKSAISAGTSWAKRDLLDIYSAINTPESLKQMVELAQLLVADNDAEAMARLAKAYRDGRGVDKDLSKAAKLMGDAAKLNLKWAKYEYFDIAWKIKNTNLVNDAVHCLEPLIDEGQSDAIIRVARAYKEGVGVEKDTFKALDLTRLAASKGTKWAKYELADILYHQNTPESLSEMMAIIRPLAESNDPEAMARLGRAYRDGMGVEKNLDKAITWMKKSADCGLNWVKKELFEILLMKNTTISLEEKKVTSCNHYPGYYHQLFNKIIEIQNCNATNKEAAISLINWNLKSLFKKFDNDTNTYITKISSDEKTILDKFQLPEITVNIGFLINGGLGDFLIAANYIYYFKNKFPNCSIDIFAHNNISSAETIFDRNVLIREIYLEDQYKSSFNKYDLFIKISRFPEIWFKNELRLSERYPEILEYVFTCEKFKATYSRFFLHSGITDGQSAVLSILNRKKRIQQPDIYGYFGINEEYQLSIPIRNDEKEFLDRYNLKPKQYITVHRGCDDRYSRDSVKLWPTQYYNTLLKLIKDNYPKITIVQIGISHDRCETMRHTDVNLISQTSLETLKIILKNSLLHIDGEGGMVHLRHALHGGKSVVIFGPTSADFFGYSDNINITGLGCKIWCEWVIDKWMNRCLRGNKIPPCMASICPEEVFSKIRGEL